MRPALLALLFAAATTAHAQFEMQNSHTTASLRGIHSVDGNVAWASGTEGTVLRTTDAGSNWRRCPTPPNADNLDFRGIQAFDQNTAIVMSSGKGDLSRLYKTTDGCKSWKLLFTNPDKEGFWDAIQFSKDLARGVLLGDPVDRVFVILLTFNGGERWERQSFNATADMEGESVFAASNSSLLPPYPGYHRFCTGGFGGPRVIRLGSESFNQNAHKDSPARRSWNTALSTERLKSYKQRPSSGCFSLFEDPTTRTIVAVGGDYMNPDDKSYNAWTSSINAPSRVDERNEFQLAQTPPHGYRSSVAYDADTKTWITVGPNGTDISSNGGRNWAALKPDPQDQPDADKNWNALSLPFVVGPKGRIGRLRPNAIPH